MAKSKSSRKLSASEVATTLRLGRKISSRSLKLTYLPNSLNHSRFCFIISKKISPLATNRNLLKRHLFEFFRTNFDSLISEISPQHFDLIIGFFTPPSSSTHNHVFNLSNELVTTFINHLRNHVPTKKN